MSIEEREEEQQVQQPEVDPRLVVDVSPQEEDEQDADGQPAADDDKKGRRARYREMKEARERDQQEKEEMRREIAELRGRVSERQRPEPQQRQEENPHLAQAQQYERQMRIIMRAINSSPKDTPQSELDEMAESYRQYQAAHTQAIVQASMPAQQPAPNVEALMLRAQFKDIYARPSLLEEARIEALRLSERSGRPVDYAIAFEANTRVMQRHKPGSAPNPALQGKLASTSSRAGASGGSSEQVVLTPQQRNAALATYNGHPKYGQLSEKEKIAKWTKEVWLKKD
jgi:hypothetical protein